MRGEESERKHGGRCERKGMEKCELDLINMKRIC